MKKIIYFDWKIKWSSTENVEFTYHTQFNGHTLQIRVNDFPDEILYSLIVDGELISDFDDWPVNWER